MSAPPEIKDSLQAELVKLLRIHARAAVLHQLGHLPEGITDEAVWIAIRDSKKFRGDSKFSTWFHGIVRKLCWRYIRDKGPKEVGLTEAEHIAIGSSLEDNIAAQLELEQIKEELDEESRLLLDLRLAGHTWEETAEAMALPADAVRQRWGRLKQEIITLFGGGSAESERQRETKECHSTCKSN